MSYFQNQNDPQPSPTDINSILISMLINQSSGLNVGSLPTINNNNNGHTSKKVNAGKVNIVDNQSPLNALIQDYIYRNYLHAENENVQVKFKQILYFN